jgi:hypothetical protein
MAASSGGDGAAAGHKARRAVQNVQDDEIVPVVDSEHAPTI